MSKLNLQWPSEQEAKPPDPVIQWLDGVLDELADQLYVSLHFGDDFEHSAQDHNEVAYPGYQRQAVPRDAESWTPAKEGVSKNRVEVSFPPLPEGWACVVTHIKVGLKPHRGTALFWEPANPHLDFHLSSERQVFFPPGSISMRA